MKKRKGSFYLYTFIIFMICISLISILLVLFNKDYIIKGKEEMSGFYPIEVDALDYSLDILNKELYRFKYSEKLTFVSRTNIDYCLSESNKYTGKFIHRNELLNLSFYELFIKNFNNTTYNYTITDIYTYDVTLNFRKNNKDIVVGVIIYNNDLNIKKEVIKKVRLNTLAYFNPKLKYKSTPDYLNGIYVIGNYNNVFQYIDGDKILNFNITENNFSFANPILISNQKNIDISNFYLDDIPVNTILIVKEDSTLYSSQINKNIFNGLIIAENNIEFSNEIIVNGSLYVKGDIDGKNLIFSSEPNKVLDFTSSDYRLYYEILDSLELTNFQNSNKVTDAKDIFHNIKINGFKEIYAEELYFEYK